MNRQPSVAYPRPDSSNRALPDAADHPVPPVPVRATWRETVAMKRTTGSRRRPAIQITLERAARLHRLVLMLAQRPSSRAEILQELQIGMRTFYRELELLQRYRIKVQQKDRAYSLRTTAEQAEGRLPFPDPQLSFAEMAELAGCPSPAGRRLAELLASVMHYPEGTPRGTQGRRRGVDVPTRKSS